MRSYKLNDNNYKLLLNDKKTLIKTNNINSKLIETKKK